jgi:hypothetical protein
MYNFAVAVKIHKLLSYLLEIYRNGLIPTFVHTINPLDAKPFSLISAKRFLVKFVYREVMTLSV